MVMNGLERFHIDAPEPAEFVADLDFSFRGRMLCCDQSITSTGFVVLHFGLDGRVTICQWGTIKTEPTGIKGYEDYLLRIEIIAGEIKHVVDEVLHGIDLIAHEAPPMGGGLRKPESSLSAAVAIRAAAVILDIPAVSIHGKHAKKVLTNNGNADKLIVREALGRWVDLSEIRMNEHISDALALGLVAATEYTA